MRNMFQYASDVPYAGSCPSVPVTGTGGGTAAVADGLEEGRPPLLGVGPAVGGVAVGLAGGNDCDGSEVGDCDDPDGVGPGVVAVGSGVGLALAVGAALVSADAAGAIARTNVRTANATMILLPWSCTGEVLVGLDEQMVDGGQH